MSMKYVYIVSTQHFGPLSQGSSAILGVHTSKRSANEHYDTCVDNRRKMQMPLRLAFSPPEGNYPPEIQMPEKRMHQVYINYKDNTSEQLKMVRWVVCRPSQLKGKHDRRRKKAGNRAH